VDVVWKPRAIKSLLALSVKCVRANLDKLKPLVPVLPHELQQRINPLEVKVHDSTFLPSLSILPPMFSRTDAPHTTQHNTTQHNTTQHNTTQHNTTQHNTHRTL
jgi:hypothetical protein